MMTIFFHWPLRVLLFLCFINFTTNCQAFDWKELASELKKGKWYDSRNDCNSIEVRMTESPEIVPDQIEGSAEWIVIGPLSDDDVFDRSIDLLCQCDEECHYYKDCCYDVAMTEPKVEERIIDRELLGCVPLHFEDHPYEFDRESYIYMIHRCPPDWEGNESLPLLCQRDPSLTDYSYLLDLPVFSLATNRSYANLFCAECHMDNDRLAKWNVSVECDGPSRYDSVAREKMLTSSNYKSGLREWYHTMDDRGISGCRMIIEEFIDYKQYIEISGSRRCVLSIGKEKCAPDWIDPIIEQKCQAYSYLVLHYNFTEPYLGPTIYKNPHCAICNHIPADQIDRYMYNKITPRTSWESSLRDTSFPLLVDFDFSGVRELNRQNSRCPNDETYDAFREQCIPIICGAAFINQNGLCVKRNMTEDQYDEIDQINWSGGGLMNSSCRRIRLLENRDFVWLDNRSFILNRTNQIIDPKDYELTQDGNITICEDEDLNPYSQYSDGQHVLSDLCLTISVVSLAFHIGIHLSIPKLRNLPGKNLLSLACALFIAQLLFLVGIGLRDTVGFGLCATIGVLIHWSYLAAFFWMNVMGFDICRTFTGSRHRGMAGHDSTFRWYSLYAWGLPTLIIVFGLSLDLGVFLAAEDEMGTILYPWVIEFAPSYGVKFCWISNRCGLGVLFALPTAIILMANLTLFIITVFSIVKQYRAAQFAVNTNQTNRSSAGETIRSTSNQMEPSASSSKSKPNNNEHKIRFMLYVKLGLIMGLGWIFGFVATLTKQSVLWYPFIFFNALQGGFILVAFSVKRKVYYMVYRCVTKHPHPSDTSSSSRVTPNNSRTVATRPTNKPGSVVSQNSKMDS